MLHSLRTSPGAGSPVGNAGSGNVKVRSGWSWGASHWFVGITLLLRIDNVGCVSVCMLILTFIMEPG